MTLIEALPSPSKLELYCPGHTSTNPILYIIHCLHYNKTVYVLKTKTFEELSHSGDLILFANTSFRGYFHFGDTISRSSSILRHSCQLRILALSHHWHPFKYIFSSIIIWACCLKQHDRMYLEEDASTSSAALEIQ